MMTCQVSYLALATDEFETETEKILDVIRDSGLEHHIGTLATEIRGHKAELLALIEKLVNVAEGESRYVLDVRLSNTCGC